MDSLNLIGHLWQRVMRERAQLAAGQRRPSKHAGKQASPSAEKKRKQKRRVSKQARKRNR